MEKKRKEQRTKKNEECDVYCQDILVIVLFYFPRLIQDVITYYTFFPNQYHSDSLPCTHMDEKEKKEKN